MNKFFRFRHKGDTIKLNNFGFSLKNAMLLGFKTQLKLNQTQGQQLARHAGVARHA